MDAELIVTGLIVIFGTAAVAGLLFLFARSRGRSRGPQSEEGSA